MGPFKTFHALLWLLAASLALHGQSLLAWKGLVRGPLAVGFRCELTRDPARSFQSPRDFLGRPRPDPGHRPIQVAIWYPAQGGSGTSMDYGHYMPMLAWAQGAKPPEERATNELEYLQAVTPLAKPVDRATWERLLKERVWARRDALPAPGRFPTLIYAPGMDYPAFDNSVLFEFLASHGYVVIACPSIGADTRRVGYDALAMEAQARDLEFLVGHAQSLPMVDAARLGSAGFSGGGIPSTLLALRNTHIKALVSLDGTLREQQSLAIARALPHFDPLRLRVPALVITRAADSKEPVADDASFTDKAAYSALDTAVFPGLAHHDLCSFSNALRRCSAQGKDRDWAQATQGYEALCGLVLAFLDARLKGQAGAMERLQDGPHPGFALARRTARPAPPTAADFRDLLEAEGAARAAEAIRTLRKNQPEALPNLEATLNLCGYEMLWRGRTQEALTLFELGAECFPDSLNATDSLGEACLAAGLLDRAEACYRKVWERLDKIPDLGPRERKAYLDSAERGLAAVRKRREQPR